MNHPKRQRRRRSRPAPRRRLLPILALLMALLPWSCKTAQKQSESDKRKPAVTKSAPKKSVTVLAPPRAPRQEMEEDSVSRSNDGKRDKKKSKPKSGVWKRSEKGTLLSKVSVGGKKYLQLKKMRVTVRVEGIRVRTVVDHIYYNPHGRTLQGTFKYTLPPNASISYYAMFVGNQQQRSPRFFSGKAPAPRQLIAMKPQDLVRRAPKNQWGKLREARLVGAIKGREVYERITRRRIDPALVEQEAPNTFSARVFPIPSKGYNRVIMAYEQTLPSLASERVYRFRFPNDVAEFIDFSLEYNKSLARLTRDNLKKIHCASKEAQTLIRCYWEKNKPTRDAVFYFKTARDDAAWLAGTDPINGQKYLLAQLRVKLPKLKSSSGASQAVFLLDTSLSQNPDRFAASVALLKKILEKNSALKRFNLLFFDVGATWADSKGWVENSATNRQALYQRLDRILLEGATNIDLAMSRLAQPEWLKQAKRLDLDVFMLSDGQLNWGNRNLDAILGRFKKSNRWGTTRFFAYYMGIGSENLGLFQRLTRLGGAVFSCLGQSELDRCATAHTRKAMQLQTVQVDGIDASEVLVGGRQASLYPDALVTIASRYGRDGNATVTLRGRFAGQKHSLSFKLPIKARGDLAPRGWAELAVAQLLELDDPKQRKLIVAYSQHFHLANKYCSFLVLETDKEYKQYGLESAKKGLKVADLAKFIERVLASRAAPVTPRTLITALLRRGAKRIGMLDKRSGRDLFALLAALPEHSFRLDPPQRSGVIEKSSVPKTYLSTRNKDRNDFDPFVLEAKRRLALKKVAAAVRALSSIVELHPSDPRALRLVGYYLMSWDRPSEAAQVFLRVLERRPFEPHSYRDLARSLIKLKRFGLAGALYEVILGGNWRRFSKIHTVAREEYALMLQQALGKSGSAQLKRALTVGDDAAQQIQSRLRMRKTLLGLSVPKSNLRVTMTWNTDNTDIDLWVDEPSGERVWYKKKRSSNGGVLLQDVTWGYGPERYQNVGGKDGTYRVKLQFYGHRSTVLGNETHINVIIVVKAGTPEQRIIEKNLVLKKRKQVVNVATVKF